jgi:single-stranded DNA-specific DHH superfamily exonuclease
MGGHELAGGFRYLKNIFIPRNTINKRHMNRLRKMIMFAAKNIFIDCELPLSLVNYKTMDDIDRLAPYGVGNQKPTFLI